MFASLRNSNPGQGYHTFGFHFCSTGRQPPGLPDPPAPSALHPSRQRCKDGVLRAHHHTFTWCSGAQTAGIHA